MSQTTDMDPRKLRARLVERGVSQAAISRRLGVSPSMVHRVIAGQTVSDRVRRAVAEAAGVAVERIWPSTYIYGGGPRGPGRPVSEDARAQVQK